MPILEKQGYTFEATELTLQYADEAIADGDVDFSVEQHIAYMDAFNKNCNSNFGGTDTNSYSSGIYFF